VPLRSVIFWCGLLLVAYAVSATVWRARGNAVRRAITAGPALVVLMALSGSVVIMLGSFVSAPLRRPIGSLAESNWRWLTGQPSCAFADAVEVLADGDILTAADTAEYSSGFTARGGFAPGVPPPDPPGSGMSTYLWGSRNAAPGPATLTTQWFTLPAPGTNAGLSASVVGPAGPATVVFDFGRADRSAVAPLGLVGAAGTAPPDLNAQLRVWRVVTVDAAQIPAGADRVRLHVDAPGGPTSWMAITGPRRNARVSLTDFLAGRGPVLLSWQQSFVFPCVRDVARVADGIAQTPRVMVVTSGPWFTEPQDERPAGVFAGLQPFGHFYQVPARVVGHPEIQWGAVLLSRASADEYDLRLDQVRRPGRGDRHALYQVDLPR
jgi:arabinosyltransferase C